MKYLLLLTLTFSISFSSFAQQNNQDPNVRALDEKFQTGIMADTYQAILDAGKSGNKAFVPYLKKLASNPHDRTLFNSIETYAEIALASLGEEEYISLILKQVDDESMYLQDVAIKQLSYVGGKYAYKTFLRLLDDCQYRSIKITEEDVRQYKETGKRQKNDDETFLPRSFVVIQLLAKMVENPPVSPDVRPDFKHIAIWKDWFTVHSYLLQ